MLAVCSLSFGHEYNWRLDRLKVSMDKTNPTVPFFYYKDEYPKAAKPYNQSLYGFKPHLIEEMIDKGFTKIIYLDATMIVNGDLNWFHDAAIPYGGVLAVQDDNKLDRFVSNAALAGFGHTREQAKSMHMVGGSFYYFDITQTKAFNVFAHWSGAEETGLFGSQKDESEGKLQGHRHDEACMALALYKHGSKPFTGDTQYNYSSGSILTKSHFK